MNKLWSEIKELFQLGPLNLLRQYKLLSEELILIKKSSKCIIVQPTVEVKGLSKLKRALMLQGDNMIIQNNKINMVASKKDMACI